MILVQFPLRQKRNHRTFRLSEKCSSFTQRKKRQRNEIKTGVKHRELAHFWLKIVGLVDAWNWISYFNARMMELMKGWTFGNFSFFIFFFFSEINICVASRIAPNYWHPFRSHVVDPQFPKRNKYYYITISNGEWNFMNAYDKKYSIIKMPTAISHGCSHFRFKWSLKWVPSFS